MWIGVRIEMKKKKTNLNEFGMYTDPLDMRYLYGV